MRVYASFSPSEARLARREARLRQTGRVVMRRWRSPGVRVTIRPAAEAYEVGQSIKVRVTAEAKRDSSIRSASAYLIASIWYGKPPRAHAVPPYGPVWVEESRPAIATVSKIALGIPAAIRAGDRAECEAVLPNLATAPSGGSKSGRRIAYSVQVQAHLADGGVARGTAPVHLLSPRSLYQQVEGTAMELTQRQSRKCDLELELSPLHVQPGDILRGVLRIRPRENVRSWRVTVRTVRVETFTKEKRARTLSYDDYRRHDVKFPLSRTLHRSSGVSLRRHGTLTGQREIPFVVRLGRDAAPTMFTRYLSMRWYVQATVAYSLFAQDDCGLELNVHTGR